jgi:ABC-type multidrug transport system ATPase subunit
MTALENLQLVARLMGKDASRDAIMPLLEEVGLGERVDDNILSFSAGMRKRISIARVLLQDADVVMLDEPYGQLDPPGFRFVDKLFTKLRDRGVTIMMATHLLDRGAALCDLGVVLERGRLQWAGDAKDLPRLGGLDPASTPEGAQ